MLDRLAAGLVTLPDSSYDLILILTDADGTRSESGQLLGRDVFGRIVQALKAGGKLQAQDGTFGRDAGGDETREAILAGLVAEGGAMVKPDYSASEAVPLRLRRKDKSAAVSNAGLPVVTATVPLNGKRKSVDMSQSKPTGVGFVDFSDDFGDPMITGEDDDDDELIDEDTLLTEEDLKRPANIRKSIQFLKSKVYLLITFQLPSACPELESVAVLARTVPVVLLRELRKRMQPNGLTPMLNCRLSNLVLTILLR
jgi:hypothetical protein